jgi:hypothetical protein
VRPPLNRELEDGRFISTVSHNLANENQTNLPLLLNTDQCHTRQ